MPPDTRRGGPDPPVAAARKQDRRGGRRSTLPPAVTVPHLPGGDSKDGNLADPGTETVDAPVGYRTSRAARAAAAWASQRAST